MGLSTVTESQLQRLSGSGVATATGDRTSPTPKQPRHPPIILVPLEPKWPSGRRDTWQDKRQRSSEGRGASSRLANIVACSTQSLREG